LTVSQALIVEVAVPPRRPRLEVRKEGKKGGKYRVRATYRAQPWRRGLLRAAWRGRTRQREPPCVSRSRHTLSVQPCLL